MSTAGFLATALMVSACKGLPEAPNLRHEMNKSLNVLGVNAFYPLNEKARIGQIYLSDDSFDSSSFKDPRSENSFLLSEVLVKDFEDKRRNTQAINTRYGKTDNEDLNDGLMLAAFPGFKLASIEQASLTTFIPQKVASFLTRLGLRKARSLTMEVKGVKVAELPLEDLAAVITKRCNDGAQENNLLSNYGKNSQARNLIRLGLKELATLRGRRYELEKIDQTQIEPVIHLISRVYYATSITYIMDASDVSNAQLQAAVTQQFPEKHQPPAITNVFVNPNTASPRANNLDLDAAIASSMALQPAESPTGTNAQVGGMFIRATGTGIELQEKFDRPLAFGFQNYSFPVRRDKCELRLEKVSNDDKEKQLIDQFRDEFDPIVGPKRDKCAVLIVQTANHLEKSTLAGFNDSGEFRGWDFNESSDPLLWAELKKDPINEPWVIDLATIKVGRTPTVEEGLSLVCKRFASFASPPVFPGP